VRNHEGGAVRAFIPAYELVSPSTLSEALEMMAVDPGRWRPFAGGTDLMVLLEAGKLQHHSFIDLLRLNELRGITVDETHVTIGALTSYTEIREHALVQKEFPMLCEAAAQTGGLAIQNRGTIGGNIANGSPAADTPPALLAYDAELELMSTSGSRRMAYDGFHSGYKVMDLKQGELITAVRIRRRPSGWTDYYRKVGTRKAQAVSKICFAGTALVQDGHVKSVRLCMGSVAPTVVRCRNAEDALSGQALDSEVIKVAVSRVEADISPIDDVRSNSRYRMNVSKNLVRTFLELL
jgi:CO/xanthine dehydrogenase FAD-binding subunit